MKSQNGTKGRFKSLARKNITLARRLDPGQSPGALDQLRDLTLNFGFSLATGELLHLNGGWYVTHAALLRLAYSEDTVLKFKSSRWISFPIKWLAAGFSKQLSSRAPLRRHS
jgi:hypothetical protein